MAVSLEVTETSTVVEGPDGDLYRVVWVTTNATEIAEEVFLHNSTTGLFSRTCRAGDMQFPTDPSPLTALFHRRNTATADYASITAANAAKANVATAIALLVPEYQAALDGFIGVVVITAP